MSMRAPDAADREIGARLRMRRIQQGLTQTALATRLGLTFQQIQRYENGKNRIPGSRLHLIAGCLGVSVSYFYGEDPECTRLVSGFGQITDTRKRQAILSLVESMAADLSG